MYIPKSNWVEMAMKYAICNELFTDPAAVNGDPWDWKQQCDFAAEVGYTGVEVAPFTLGDHPAETPIAVRNKMREDAEAAGVEIVGLHWLLAKTDGYHMTTADSGVRKRTGEYLADLAKLCSDLGGSVMVLGSPQQRNIESGMTYEQAETNAVETIQHALNALSSLNVTLCLEPLGETETNFMLTCGQARSIIDRLECPNVQLHQDVKAMCHETTPIPELISEFADITKHFHANDQNLRGPGMGAVDYHPIFSALKASGYDGFVSVEVFDYSPGAVDTARESLQYMRKVEAAINDRQSTAG